MNFTERSAAETAAQAWANGLDFGEERASVRWGRSKAAKSTPVIV